VLASAALLATVALAGCGGSGRPKVPDGAVAQVGSTTITASSLAAMLASARASYAEQQTTFPTKGTKAYANVRSQAVEYLVQTAMFEQRAASVGVDVGPKQVDAAIAKIEQQSFNGNEKLFDAALKAQGLTLAELRIQERLTLTEQAVRKRVTKGITVSDTAARAYYAKHASTYKTKTSRVVRHILVAKRSLARSIYAKLRNGASFAKLVQRYSTDTGSKSKGGRITDTKGTLVPAFEKVAFSLKTNEISKPVHSQYGWHIIQALTPVHHAAAETYAQAEASIKATLLQQREAAALKTWTTEVVKAFCPHRVAYAKGYAPASTATNPCASAGR